MLAGERPLGLAVSNNETARGGHDARAQRKTVRVEKERTWCVGVQSQDQGDCCGCLQEIYIIVFDNAFS